jgi:hypothetical protein
VNNGEKLQKTMEETSRRFQNAPEFLKRDSSRPQSASIYRTVQPMADTKKR